VNGIQEKVTKIASHLNLTAGGLAPPASKSRAFLDLVDFRIAREEKGFPLLDRPWLPSEKCARA